MRVWSGASLPFVSWHFCLQQNDSNCPPQDSVVLEPGVGVGEVYARRCFLRAHVSSPSSNAISSPPQQPPCARGVLGNQPSSWACTLGSSCPRKILKVYGNVWKEPQEEGRAVAWIIPSCVAPDALRMVLDGLQTPREVFWRRLCRGRGELTQAQTRE